MELLSGGELLARARAQQRPFGEPRARAVMAQLASALRFMHARGVVHRDLKPENVVFVHPGEDSPVKLVDFGFARLRRACEPLHTPCFTLPYAAPEVLARQAYDESCDLWSLGAILYSMLTGKPPGRAEGAAELDLRADELVARLSGSGRQVLRGLLAADPAVRLSAAALASHSWILGAEGTEEVAPHSSHG
jgi:ribosomal protein S6 kinase alpha-5